MKQVILLSTVMLVIVFLLPVIAVGQPLYVKPAPDVLTPSDAPAQTPSPPPAASPDETQEPLRSFDEQCIIKVQDGQEILELALEDYLLGVLAAEMPASFPEDALRAQAVAARTYTIYKSRHPSSDGAHPDAPVCTNSGHCKAYTSPSRFKELWGDDCEEYTQKLRDAVTATDGQIVTYNDEPILAVFHSASSGNTERAADVWGNDFPYLQSVESPGEDVSPRYYGSVELTHEEFKTTFTALYPAAVFGGTPQGWFTNIERSESGGIIRLMVGGVVITGSRLRSMFGLQSTNMTITANDTSIKITTLGHGHGVGMSQYGARALALEGKDYVKILEWYYSGAHVNRLTVDN